MMSKFLLLLWEKNDRNLKNILWTQAICTTMLFIPKFQPIPILWTHATHAKISTHVTHNIFLTHAKILWTRNTHTQISTHANHAIFWPTPKFYRPMPPMQPMPKFDSCHPQTHTPMLPTLPMPTTLFRRLVYVLLQNNYFIKKIYKNVASKLVPGPFQFSKNPL